MELVQPIYLSLLCLSSFVNWISDSNAVIQSFILPFILGTALIFKIRSRGALKCTTQNHFLVGFSGFCQ